MDEQSILKLIGLIYKSKNLTFGDTMLEKAKKGLVQLVIVANDIGSASLRKIQNACSHHQIPIIKVADKARLAQALGKGSISNIGVMSIGFKNKILEE